MRMADDPFGTPQASAHRHTDRRDCPVGKAHHGEDCRAFLAKRDGAVRLTFALVSVTASALERRLDSHGKTDWRPTRKKGAQLVSDDEHPVVTCLEQSHVLCLKALGTLCQIELHLLTFLKAAEATSLNS